jgi:putative addiction module component (TIGR02574 family)
MSLHQLIDEALRLPESDRAALAAAMIESFDPETADESAAEWHAEIRRRLDDLDAGAAVPVPWQVAWNQTRGER